MAMRDPNRPKVLTEDELLEYRLRQIVDASDILAMRNDITAAGRERWEELKEEARLLPVWAPDSDVQKAAVDSKADFKLFVGAVRSGKTNCALGIGMTRHRRMRICRHDAQAAARVVAELYRYTRDTESCNFGAREWALADPAMRLRQVYWGGLKDFADFKQLMGYATDFTLYDEMPHLPIELVRDSSAWVMTTEPGQVVEQIGTMNPETMELMYDYIEMFAPWMKPDYPREKKAEFGEPRWFLRNPITGIERECREGETLEVEKPDGTTEVYHASSRTVFFFETKDNSYIVNREGYQGRLAATLTKANYHRRMHGDLAYQEEQDPTKVIPSAWIERAQENWMEAFHKYGEEGWRDPRFCWTDTPYMCAMGFDVSDMGRDKNVLVMRWGSWFSRPLFAPANLLEGDELADWALGHRRHNCPFYYDLIGVGAKMRSPLKEKIPERAVPLKNSWGTKELCMDREVGFRTLRSYYWWRFRQALNPDNIRQMAIPPGGNILQEAKTPHYKQVTGQIYVETKEEIFKRIRRSTDILDSILMSATGWICPHRPPLKHILGERFVHPSLSDRPAHMPIYGDEEQDGERPMSRREAWERGVTPSRRGGSRYGAPVYRRKGSWMG